MLMPVDACRSRRWWPWSCQVLVLVLLQTGRILSATYMCGGLANQGRSQANESDVGKRRPRHADSSSHSLKSIP